MTDDYPQGTALDLNVKTNSYTIPLSREQAIDYGFVQATPEEIAERNAAGERFHAEQRALRAAFREPIRVLNNGRGLVAVMAEMHAPVESDYDVTCKGCPPDRENGPQDWPCETIGAVAEWARVPLPGSSMPGKRYEDEWTPWDGTPFRFRLPLLNSFANLTLTDD